MDEFDQAAPILPSTELSSSVAALGLTVTKVQTELYPSPGVYDVKILVRIHLASALKGGRIISADTKGEKLKARQKGNKKEAD